LVSGVPRLVDLLPPLVRLTPPAAVFDKRVYLRTFNLDFRHLSSPSWLDVQMPRANRQQKRKKPMAASDFPVMAIRRSSA
jgi:hypothetical protein